MPTLSAYPNGLTAGVAGRNDAPSLRGEITGWSAGAVRRHTRWLYSVDAPALDGFGYALTLTLKDCPPTADDFQRLRRNWLDRQRRSGMIRLHWVVEWQRRGVPHVHAAVYFDHELVGRERWELLTDWLDVAAEYGAAWRSQDVKPIDGPMGWLQYLSKHAARGVRHYQRWAKPEGWHKTGRLWGHVGDWPTLDPQTFDLSMDEYWRFRRLVRTWRVRDAQIALLAARDDRQRAAARRRIAAARRMLKSNDRARSSVRGVSEWIDLEAAGGFLEEAAQRSYAALAARLGCDMDPDAFEVPWAVAARSAATAAGLP